MKRFITLLILAAMCGLVWWQYQTQYSKLQSHQHQVKDESASQGLVLQHDCLTKALARFNFLGLASNKSANYKGHYSASLGQCYALIGSNETSLDTVWKHLTLYDADGKVFASYAWHSQDDQKAADIPPYTCEVTLPSGEERTCKSEADFRDLIGAYMK
jgi:hypothetical protein